MKQIIKYGIIAIVALCLITTSQSKKCEASNKTTLVNKIKAKTSEKVRDVFYTDYDYDGLKEAFVITEKSKDEQTL